VLLDLQRIFSTSALFAPLLAFTRQKKTDELLRQPIIKEKKDEESDGRFFRMGHGGTLDPMASGVLIVGIGRGTRSLSGYLNCSKTYETVILFGKSTDTYDADGEIIEQKDASHVDEALVTKQLAKFRGKSRQMPPAYSALKIHGIKACQYLRQGKELPRALVDREVYVEECSMTKWMGVGEHDFRWPDDESPATAPAARINLIVSSGFYVRSFANDLGIACGTVATMVELVRTRQADFVTHHMSATDHTKPSLEAVSYADLEAGEIAWGPVVQRQLKKWTDENPPLERQTHVNGRDPNTKKRLIEEEKAKVRQRFHGEWQAKTRKERRKQEEQAKHKLNGEDYAEAQVANLEPSTNFGLA